MKENFSPEERLLKLIRGQKKAPRQEPGKAEAKAGPRPMKASMAFLCQHLSFSYLYKFSFILAAMAFIYLVSSLAYPLFAPKQIKLARQLPEKTGRPQQQKAVPLEFYLQGTESKKIFSVSSAVAEPESAICGDSDLIKTINLVGIISGDNPQAVIEDVKTQKTYYVTKSQYIGEFQVENIEQSKIVVNFRGKRYELSL